MLPIIDDAFKAELRRRLASSEDGWIERKPGLNDGGRDARKTLVAFANSIKDGEYAVLFIGASDIGAHRGVSDPDEIQKKVAEIANDQCYPPIECKFVVLDNVLVEGGEVKIVAVIVPPSKGRPHFSGQSYVRQGSKSVVASEKVMHDLISGQNDKARVLQEIREAVLIEERSARGLFLEFTGFINNVTAHSIEVKDTSGEFWNVSLENVEIMTLKPSQIKVRIPPRGTEERHLIRMLEEWVMSFGSNAFMQEGTKMNNYLVEQFLPIAAQVESVMAGLQWNRNGAGTPKLLLYRRIHQHANASRRY